MNGWFCKRTGVALWMAVLTLGAASAHAAIGAWTTGGPEGGQVAAIVTDPNNADALFAATTGASHGGAGVFFSGFRGQFWKPRNGGLTHREINALAVTSAGGRTVFYAGSYHGGVFRSEDFGLNWSPASAGLSNLDVNALAVDRADPDLVYAGTYGGMFRSADGGASWASNLTGVAIASVIVDPLRAGTLYAAGGSSVFVSSDRGMTWQVMRDGLDGAVVDVVAIWPARPDVLLAGTSRGVFARDLSDPAAGWTLMSRVPLGLNPVRAIAFDPADPATLYLGGGTFGVAVSRDAGASWRQLPSALQPAYVDALVVRADGTLYAGGDDGFFAYSAAAGWTASNRGLTAQVVTAVAAAPRGAAYAATSSGGLFRTTKGGRTWTSLIGVLPWRLLLAVAVDPADPRNVYAGANIGGLYKSADAGVSWQSVSTAPEQCWDVNAIAVARSQPSTLFIGAFCSGGGKILRSNDGGATWSAVLSGVTTRAIAVDPEDASIVYAAASSWPIAGDIYKSSDGGASWMALDAGVGSVTSLTVRPDEPQVLFATGEAGRLVRSDDGGTSWIAGNGGLPPLPLRDVVVDAADREMLYVAVEGAGVWSSTDGGASWAPFGNGALNPNATALASDGLTFYAGTAGSVYDLEQ